MQNKMSARKTKIAKKLEAFNMDFDGQKANGVYRIGIVTCRTLDEVEAYIKELEQAKEKQSAPESSVVESVKSAENWWDWENALKSQKISKEGTNIIRDISFSSSHPTIVDGTAKRNEKPRTVSQQHIEVRSSWCGTKPSQGSYRVIKRAVTVLGTVEVQKYSSITRVEYGRVEFNKQILLVVNNGTFWYAIDRKPVQGCIA